MAYGDTRSTRGRSGGGGSSNEYNDEGRGYSSDMYEKFTRRFDGNCANLFDETVLTASFIESLIQWTTYRYNVHDFVEGINYQAYTKVSDFDNGDGRIKRDITKICDDATWKKFLARVLAIKDERAERLWMSNIGSAIYSGIREEVWRADDEKRKAIQLTRQEEEVAEYRKNADLTVGALHSDFEASFKIQEQYGQREGDWLDDPVSAYLTGYGFGEETRQAAGVKFQVTLSLDLSNSMRHNGVHEKAREVAINLQMAFEQLVAQYPDQIYFGSFLFSYDIDEEVESSTYRWGSYRKTWNYVRRLGRGAKALESSSYQENTWNEHPDAYLGKAELFKNVWFDGEDTWLYPLFGKIEAWENEHSDNGAIKLDLIISDAVLEHPSDIRQSDVIQDRRDGSLQSIILNLMPEGNWHNGALPRNCVQYSVNKDNLAGTARQLISEFLQIYV